MVSQASFPRSVTLPQLPSPRVVSYELFIWYNAPLSKGLELNTRDFHPIRSRPCWAYMDAKGSIDAP
jgi:hypothetical protein